MVLLLTDVDADGGMDEVVMERCRAAAGRGRSRRCKRLSSPAASSSSLPSLSSSSLLTLRFFLFLDSFFCCLTTDEDIRDSIDFKPNPPRVADDDGGHVDDVAIEAPNSCVAASAGTAGDVMGVDRI